MHTVGLWNPSPSRFHRSQELGKSQTFLWMMNATVKRIFLSFGEGRSEEVGLQGQALQGCFGEETCLEGQVLLIVISQPPCSSWWSIPSWSFPQEGDADQCRAGSSNESSSVCRLQSGSHLFYFPLHITLLCAPRPFLSVSQTKFRLTETATCPCPAAEPATEDK